VQLDISAGLALAVLALIAVLPEYAVDFVFTWKAGENPEKYALMGRFVNESA
jgi:cation:H+ antiporter